MVSPVRVGQPMRGFLSESRSGRSFFVAKGRPDVVAKVVAQNGRDSSIVDLLKAFEPAVPVNLQPISTEEEESVPDDQREAEAIAKGNAARLV